MIFDENSLVFDEISRNGSATLPSAVNPQEAEPDPDSPGSVPGPRRQVFSALDRSDFRVLVSGFLRILQSDLAVATPSFHFSLHCTETPSNITVRSRHALRRAARASSRAASKSGRGTTETRASPTTRSVELLCGVGFCYSWCTM